jgi:hypothetical protein
VHDNVAIVVLTPWMQFVISRHTEEILIGSDTPTFTESGATKVRRHPNVKDIPGARTTATSIKFRNLSAKTIEIWYDNSTPEGSFQGELKSGQDSTTNAYEGHIFFFTEKGNKKNELARFTITAEKAMF